MTLGLGKGYAFLLKAEKLNKELTGGIKVIKDLEQKEFEKLEKKFKKDEPTGTKRDEDGKLIKKTPATERAKAVHWLGTAYHEPAWDPIHMQYMVYQQEIGKDQQALMREDPNYEPKIHWQYFITMKEPAAWKFVMDRMEGNATKLWTNMRAIMPKKAAAYCRKDDETAIPGTRREFGTDILDYESDETDKTESKMAKLAKMVRNGEKIPDSDLLRYHRGITALKQEIALESAPQYRMVEGTILWGPARSGKDSLAVDTAEANGERIYILPPIDKGGNVWFDKYEGEEHILISDFYGQISLPMMLRILDGHKLMPQIKGGFTAAKWKKVWITSNSPPEMWWPNETGTEAFKALLVDRVSEVIEMKPDKETEETLRKAKVICAEQDPQYMKNKYEDALKKRHERNEARKAAMSRPPS